MSPLVSIIVPVYKAVDYLDRCIASLSRQTYPTIEIILVDDASPDESGAYCDFWASLDERIHVLHQSTNQGVSAARNRALAVAEGTYVCFVDSDDWCEPDYIEHFVENMISRHADLACCGYFSDGLLIKATNNKPLSRHLTQGEMLQDVIKPGGDIRGFLWNKCYSRAIIVENQLQFDTSLSVMEDQLFNVSFIRDARTFWYDAYQTYHYVTHGGSASHNLSAKTFAAEMNALDKISSVIQESDLQLSLQKLLASNRATLNDLFKQDH